MKVLERIKAKIGQIEKLCAEVKSEMDSLTEKFASGQPKRKREETLPSESELKAEYNRLYSEFINNNHNIIEEFIKINSKKYLNAFCKANSLPLDTSKASKNKICTEVLQWMAQRKAITKKAL